MKKADIIFDHNYLYWKDSRKKKYLEAMETLNTLTSEQKAAVNLVLDSMYRNGYENGYEDGGAGLG